MPNWCNNVLILLGKDAETIYEILQKPDTKVLFESLIETNRQMYCKNEKIDGITEVKIDDKFFDWYNHNRNEYGVKWDIPIQDVYVSYWERELQLDFDTAWNPPIEFVQKLSAKYPKLEINLKYSESGNYFGGNIDFVGGDIIYEDDLSYIEFLYNYYLDTFYLELQDLKEAYDKEMFIEWLEEIGEKHKGGYMKKEIQKFIDENY